LKKFSGSHEKDEKKDAEVMPSAEKGKALRKRVKGNKQDSVKSSMKRGE
jgi:hypothetical protein